jgi:PPM family protein phosphatase
VLRESYCLATAVLQYTAAALSDRGRKRTSNEDSFGLSADLGAYFVCDGMGGAAGGEIASALAVEQVIDALANLAKLEDLPMADAATEAVAIANAAIFSRAQRNPRLNGMGTTLVGLLARDNRVCIVNVGDSRCYRLRGDRFEQLTDDHSLVEEQVRLGRMTPAEAAVSQYRNIITRALGTQSSVTPDVIEIDADAGDLFLLCSDGLTRELTDDLIHSLLSLDLGLEGLCTRLVHAAKKAGGHDNITCILVRATG